MLFVEPAFCCSYMKQTATIVLSSRAWRLRFGAAQYSKNMEECRLCCPNDVLGGGGNLMWQVFAPGLFVETR